MPSVAQSLPSQQTAIVAEGPGKLRIRRDAPVSAPGRNVALVKTAAVAINPVDAKMLDYDPVPGATHGFDFAGTIVALGPDTPTHLRVGDRVAGFVHGMNRVLPSVGAFAEYVSASAELLLKIPDSMSFDDAASIGLGLFTAGLGVFHELKVPAALDAQKPQVVDPDKEDRFVLVAGGSTATGTRAIQFLKLAGYRPIATCSKKNADLVQKFGAEHVFDYSSPDCAAEIREYTGNTLAYALDCVAMADTTQLCYEAIGRAGGRYVTLEPFRKEVTDKRSFTIEPSWLLALTVFGRKVDIKDDYYREPQVDDYKFATALTAYAQGLLDQGKFDTHPVKVMTGGWEGVIEGVDAIRAHAPSGNKLVYPV